MIRPLVFVLAILAGAPLTATARQVPGDIATISDEFESAASLAGWRWHHEAEGWPAMVRRADVATTAAGHLYLEPATSGWYAEWHAPFLYKEVAGDFDVTTRLEAAGLAGGVPRRTWSLAGLMVRVPRGVTRADWAQGGENWLFVTTGVAQEPGVPVFETKTTVNSQSRLQLHPACAGPVQLRITRIGSRFTLRGQCGAGEWRELASFDRPDMPALVQVGIAAYTDWDTMQARYGDDAAAFNAKGIADGAPDLAVRVDWVRFARPAPH